MVELDDHLGKFGLDRPKSADRVDRVADRPDLPAPQRMRHSGLSEQRATAALRPEPRMAGIGAEQRNIQLERDVSFEGGRVVGQQVRDVWIEERTPDLLEHTGTFEQLLAEGPLAVVAHGHEPQTPARRPPDPGGKEGEVVVDCALCDR